jgi:hypothetical protein
MARTWIIRPLPMIMEGWRKLIDADSIRVATLPPHLLFGDGSVRYIIGPGNLLDNFRNDTLLLDVQSVTITPVDEEVQTAAQTPKQTNKRARKQTDKKIAQTDKHAHKQMQTVTQTPKQTALDYLLARGNDKLSVRELADATGVSNDAAWKAKKEYREAYLRQTKTGGLKQ